MTVRPSVNRFEIDDELKLRAAGQAAVTADTLSDKFDLGKLAAYWNSNGDLAVPHQFAVVVEVEAGSFDPETYVFEVGTCNAAADSALDQVLQSRAVTATGRYVFVVSREELAADADAAFLAVNLNATAGGGSISMAWNAYVAPLNGK